MKRPTIGDIAKRAGVSKGAVSFALNGRPGVSTETRSKVLAIAEQMGWAPNNAARALSAAKSGSVGLLLARPAKILGLEPFFMQLFSGIEAELSDRSLALLLQVVPDVRTECEVYRRWWAERRIDGVIVVDPRTDDPRFEVLAELGLPSVVVGSKVADEQRGGVWADEHVGVRSILEYLAALGHTRIARVAGLPELKHTQDRTDAFDEVAAELNLTTQVVHSDYSGEQGGQATRRLLSARPRPTAIMFDNDVMTVAGLSVAQEMGLTVPKDLSLVSWDDSALCRLVHPPLTTLSRDVAEYGAAAARILTAVLAGEPGRA
ncbi:MAG: LacI family DNA-binding transcriptional regulator, partial [Kibdelosporangium sp.]